MAVIVKDTVKQYGKGESRIYALDHASLEIQTGDVLCNGLAGKPSKNTLQFAANRNKIKKITKQRAMASGALLLFF